VGKSTVGLEKKEKGVMANAARIIRGSGEKEMRIYALAGVST